MSIMGNMVGAGFMTPKSFVLEAEDGSSFVGVTVGEQTVLTAGDNDVREGSVYAGDTGLSTGTKVIPSYHTQHSTRIITAGSQFTIPLSKLDRYDYTALHCMICPWNTDLNDSVSVEKVALLDQVFPVLSTEPISSVVKNTDTKSIDLGIINDTSSRYILRYITYKEIE